MSHYADVARFHRKFGLDNAVNQIGPRGLLPKELVDFRIQFLREELMEFIDAVEADDQAKMIDALVDLVYVALGTAHFYGFPWDEVWAAVQEANMKKERGKPNDSRSTRGGVQWDVVKPDGWEPPDVRSILEAWGWKFCDMCSKSITPGTPIAHGPDGVYHHACAKWGKAHGREVSEIELPS